VTSSKLSSAGVTESGFWLVKLGDWLFLAWVALIPVMRPHIYVAGRFWLQAADIVFVPAAFVYIALLLAGKRQLRLTPSSRCAILYLAALTLSACASEDRRQSFLKLPADAYVIIGAVMTASYVSSHEALRKTILAWIAGTAVTIIASAAGVFAFYVGGFRELGQNIFLDHFGTFPPGPYPRIRALFLNANMFCSYAVASTMIVVAAHEAGWISRRTSQALFWGAALASIPSLSPGLGGLFLAIGLWYWRARRFNEARSAFAGRLAAGAGIFVAVGLLLVVTISPTQLVASSVWETLRHPQPSPRDLTWIGAWRTFLAHPLLGRGLDLPAANVRYLTLSGDLQELTDAHNTWLSIMAQAGLLGVIAFAAVVFTLVAHFGWRSPSSNPVLAALDLAFLSGVFYQLLTGSFENTRHVWLMIGLVAGAHAIQEARSAGQSHARLMGLFRRA
jgi:hypothetical protein